MEPPDYENYDYLSEWKGREIQNLAERKLILKLAGHPERTLELGGGIAGFADVGNKYTVSGKPMNEPFHDEMVEIDCNVLNLELKQ